MQRYSTYKECVLLSVTRPTSSNGWSNVKNWWNNNGILDWWVFDVKPWFTKEKWLWLLDNVKEAFQEIFTNLKDSAFTWGSDMIDGFKDGISSVGDKIEGAAESVAGKIRKFLHFSRPDEGPLRDYESWMPDFMQGLSNGINKNKYLVTDALQSLTSDMKKFNGYSPNIHPSSYLNGSNYNKPIGMQQSDYSLASSNDIYNNIRQASYDGMRQALLETPTNLNVTIQVEGDPSGMFRVMRKEANDFTIRTGMAPFPT